MTKSHIIRYVHYNQHRSPKNYYTEQLLLFFPFLESENPLKEHNSTWHDAYIAHEEDILKILKKCIYFPK